MSKSLLPICWSLTRRISRAKISRKYTVLSLTKKFKTDGTLTFFWLIATRLYPILNGTVWWTNWTGQSLNSRMKSTSSTWWSTLRRQRSKDQNSSSPKTFSSRNGPIPSLNLFFWSTCLSADNWKSLVWGSPKTKEFRKASKMLRFPNKSGDTWIWFNCLLKLQNPIT